ncbi:hypothetical protein [Flavobacterium piscis]|uniref:DUF5117 domain-containing protein n=1 Tax=Flavobacterium piscis TaxID=1114874 RepID=A0ABU1YDA3_9FLAO|nr:hypothetical protein [Flavobacterium piscis]MDR7212088.1 hypothetical protein [Flavobacterium piscis]
MSKYDTFFGKSNRMKIDFFLKLILIFNTCISFAQHTKTYNMEYLKSKSKQELIEIAIKILKEKQPSLIINFDEFEGTAWGNSKEILVKFRRYIRFIPLNTEPYQYYDISVNLVTKQILPFESGYNFTFYIPSEEDKKKLNFIKEKANFPRQSDFDITITENEDHYWISNTSKTSFSKFFINKKTGLKSGVIEGSYSVNRVKPVLESIYDREETIKLSDEDEISQKTKKEIIQMAIAALKKKHPLLVLNFDDYAISVLGDSKNTLVEFKRIIRYVPLGTDPEKRSSYDITVNLNTNEILPFDDTFKTEFYIETKEDKKAIEFVNKNFGGFFSDSENIIYEGEEDYFIDLQNQYSFGKYVVNKKTGIAKPEIQGSWDPPTKPNLIEDLDVLTEIK